MLESLAKLAGCRRKCLLEVLGKCGIKEVSCHLSYPQLFEFPVLANVRNRHQYDDRTSYDIHPGALPGRT
ncbi:hypothetical protein C1280_10305 [Gemmata obscuriglobus]|uniref:Uncharacterized protein n=1 Tax=Gemmata obscuriglobus TaxID=114 RepID=A0A2Z3GXI6_9BACT|nr:hypothetical protein C1280_10305 [Gemmata obscuriglobus]